MLSIHSPFPQTPPFNAKRRTISSSSSSPRLLRAMEEDSEFSVDTEKAKEALRKLDQELQTLSKKQVGTPKVKATEVNFTRDEIMGGGDQEVVEVSGSFLTSLTIGLFIFTIVYNIFFYKVIKPSMDGPDDVIPVIKTESEAILQ